MRATRCCARHRLAALRVARELQEGAGERLRVPARDEHAVEAVGHDLAVAGDVGGDDRRAGRERLGQHHPEALAAKRRRDQQVGGREHLELALVADAAVRDDAGAVTDQRVELRLLHADEVQARRHVLAQRGEGRAARPAAPCARPPGRRRRCAAGAPRSAPPPRATRSARAPRRRWGSRGSARRRSAPRSTAPLPTPRSARAGGGSAGSPPRGCRGCSSAGWSSRCGRCRRAAAHAAVTASQEIAGTIGSWMWTTS